MPYARLGQWYVYVNKHIVSTLLRLINVENLGEGKMIKLFHHRGNARQKSYTSRKSPQAGLPLQIPQVMIACPYLKQTQKYVYVK